jgi:hypothetical protein
MFERFAPCNKVGQGDEDTPRESPSIFVSFNMKVAN